MKGREPYRCVYHAIVPTESNVADATAAFEFKMPSMVPVAVEDDAKRTFKDREIDCPAERRDVDNKPALTVADAGSLANIFKELKLGTMSVYVVGTNWTIRTLP